MDFLISGQHVNPIYLMILGFVVGVFGGFFGVGVDGAVDDGHAADADLLDDAVGAEAQAGDAAGVGSTEEQS